MLKTLVISAFPWYNHIINSDVKGDLQMSFCRNTKHQMNVFDPIFLLTKREKKRLDNSWAEIFAKEIFPLINEDRFSVIYSSNPASRPNNPVNVKVGLLMLKELHAQSDEEAIDSLFFDIRYQYALHTTSFDEQPISKNSLTDFRSAVYEYNDKNGVDLIQQEMESHAQVFAKLLDIDGKTIRMDSLMISSSCKKLSRLEIIYSCVFKLVKEISETNHENLPERFKIYLKESHRNDTIYRSRDKDLDSKLEVLIKDALELHHLYKDTSYNETESFNLMARMIGEQTIEAEEKTELRPAKEISPDSLQNPTDPDATFRTKGKGSYTGYVGNVVETIDEDNKIILQYDLEQNIYSDQKFSKDTIEKLGPQEEELKILIDGAFYSEELSQIAKENNITLIPTNLVGRSQNSETTGCEKFVIDEDKHIVLSCPAGHKPEDSSFKKGNYRAHFSKEKCNSCPHKASCPITEQKKQYLFTVTETKLHRLRLMASMKTDEYYELASKRAGVEGIPSVLRRRYDIDNLPVRGKVRVKFWYGFKIAAINCKRLIKSILRRTKKSASSLFYNHLLKVLCFQRAILLKSFI